MVAAVNDAAIDQSRGHMAHSDREASEVHRAKERPFRQWPSLDWLCDPIKDRSHAVRSQTINLRISRAQKFLIEGGVHQLSEN